MLPGWDWVDGFCGAYHRDYMGYSLDLILRVIQILHDLIHQTIGIIVE